MYARRNASIALAALLAAGVAGGVAGAAYASDAGQDAKDATALAGMKVTLQQAIATAEQKTGGRAVSADLQQDKGATHIMVETSGPQGVKTAMVDAQTGQVTSVNDGGQGEETD